MDFGNFGNYFEKFWKFIKNFIINFQNFQNPSKIYHKFPKFSKIFRNLQNCDALRPAGACRVQFRRGMQFFGLFLAPQKIQNRCEQFSNIIAKLLTLLNEKFKFPNDP